MEDKITDQIIRILKKSKGLTITELVKISKSSRHKVLTALAKLDGANKVFFRQVGMAKVYSLKKRQGGKK